MTLALNLMKIKNIIICIPIFFLASCVSLKREASLDPAIGVYYEYGSPVSIEMEKNLETVMKGPLEKFVNFGDYGNAATILFNFQKQISKQHPHILLKFYMTPEAASARIDPEINFGIGFADVSIIECIRYFCRFLDLKFKIDNDIIYIDAMTKEEKKKLKI